MRRIPGTVGALAAGAVVVTALVALAVLSGLPGLGLGTAAVAATVLGVRLAWFPDAALVELASGDALDPDDTPTAAVTDPSTLVSEQQARDAALAEPQAEPVSTSEVHAEVSRAGDHDPSTGLWSRGALDRALEVASKEPSWNYPGRVVMFVVFDDFNTIVDQHGRETGREVFAAASQRLMACLRPGDIAVRHGIDGFVIMLEKNAVMATARPVAERVIMAMAFPFMVGDEFVAMGACVGLTVSNGDLTPDGLLLTGIGAASIAKRAGRGHIIQVT